MAEYVLVTDGESRLVTSIIDAIRAGDIQSTPGDE